MGRGHGDPSPPCMAPGVKRDRLGDMGMQRQGCPQPSPCSQPCWGVLGTPSWGWWVINPVSFPHGASTGGHLEKQIFPPAGGGKGSGRAETVTRRGN